MSHLVQFCHQPVAGEALLKWPVHFSEQGIPFASSQILALKGAVCLSSRTEEENNSQLNIFSKIGLFKIGTKY